MRLVNADDLNYVRVRIYHEDGTIGGYNAVVPSSEIKNAPTVEAVPIAFIQERIEALRKLMERYKRDPLTENAAVYYAGEMFVLEELIRIWKEEKEHGNG